MSGGANTPLCSVEERNEAERVLKVWRQHVPAPDMPRWHRILLSGRQLVRSRCRNSSVPFQTYPEIGHAFAKVPPPPLHLKDRQESGRQHQALISTMDSARGTPPHTATPLHAAPAHNLRPQKLLRSLPLSCHVGPSNPLFCG